MVVRRSDARRRRLVIDPTIQSDAVEVGDTPVTAASKRKKKPQPSIPEQTDVRAYSYGADRRNQLKTTDLIPKRVVSYLLVVLVMLASLWMLNFSASNASQWSAHIGQSGVAALAIQGQGSLASWYSSFLLIISGMASLQIYALRQHRCDDYLGTYRLWIWMAVLFLIASVNCVVDLSGLATNLFQSLTSQTLGGNPWLPITIKLTALSLLVARGLYEVRESRGSLALVAVVWIAYSFAAVMQLPAAKESLVNLGSDKVMGNCMLIGTTALLLAHLTYARFIFLRAHGLITLKVRTKKAKVKKKKVAAVTKSKAAKSTKKTSAKTRSKSKTETLTEESETEQVAAKPKRVTKAKSKSKARSKPVATPETAIEKPAAPKIAVTEPPVTKPAASASKEKSPSEVLKEMAAASRAKQTKQAQSATSRAQTDDADEPKNGEILQMSKAQRRKLRKLQKQQRRAA
ncbi:MAG: hypothetical protein AB8B55_23940 [Mariniblastus sp.]